MTEERCAICWEPETPSLPLLSVHQDQPHLFHIACLLEWMRTSESKTCALCRKCLSTTEKTAVGRVERRELLLELACKSNSVHIVRMLVKDHVGASAKECALTYACTVSRNSEIIGIMLGKIDPSKVDWSDLVAEICLAGSKNPFNLVLSYLKNHENQLYSLEATTDLILSNPECTLGSIQFWISQAKLYGIKIFGADSLLLAVKTGHFDIFKLVADELGFLTEVAFKEASNGHLEVFRYFCDNKFSPSSVWQNICIYAGTTGDMCIIEFTREYLGEEKFRLLCASDTSESLVQGFFTACKENSTSLVPLWNLIPAEFQEPCLISHALNKAIQSDKYDIVKDLLRLVPEKLSVTEISYPFILACQKNALVAVDALLAEGIVDRDTKFTGIQLCVELGHAKLMRRLLLSTEIDISRNDDSLFRRCLACYGKANTPAEKENVREIANLLVSFGANIRVDNDLALVVFCVAGNMHLVGRCLDAGADPHSRNYKAIIGGFENFHFWPAMLIYTKGAPLTSGNCVAFKKAVEIGDMSFLRYIAELADFDVTANNHELFYMAIQSEHLNVAQHIWSKSNSKPPMKPAIVTTLVSEGLLANLEFLVEKGWKIGEVKDLLVAATESNSVEMLSYVLPFADDEDYRKAVQNISQAGFNIGFVRLMEDRRSVHLTSTLEQCLLNAISTGNSELALFLLDGKLEGTDLRPLLHESISHGNMSLLKALVTRGAQTVHDPDIGTAMMDAIGKGHCEVVEYLHSLGVQARKSQCLKCKCLVQAAIKSGDPEMLVLMFRISKNVVLPADISEKELSEEMLLVINEIKSGIIEV